MSQDTAGLGASSAIGAAPPPAYARPTPAHSMSFREILSELNPLQYIPVIGGIYRAVTGDTIPEATRNVGGLLFSGLTAGPIGVATNLAMLAVEKITGIDPEKIEAKALASVGIGGQTAAPARIADPPAASQPVRIAWSPAQLAAYGVTTTAADTLHRGTMQDSDVLNDLELNRIHTV